MVFNLQPPRCLHFPLSPPCSTPLSTVNTAVALVISVHNCSNTNKSRAASQQQQHRQLQQQQLETSLPQHGPAEWLPPPPRWGGKHGVIACCIGYCLPLLAIQVAHCAVFYACHSGCSHLTASSASCTSVSIYSIHGNA